MSDEALATEPALYEAIEAARPRLLRLARLNGITLDEAEDVVQETRQWCWLCGKQHLRGIFERQPSGIVALRLRCPDCSARYQADGVTTRSLLLLLSMSDTMRSFRPALKRILLASAEFSSTVLGRRRYNICQAPVRST